MDLYRLDIRVRLQNQIMQSPPSVREVEEKYAPFTPEEKAEMKEIAEKYYWRFNEIQFHPNGVRIISEDQGGWPGPAFVLDIHAEPEMVRRCSLAAIRELIRSKR